MDGVILFCLALIAVTILLRLRYTHRRTTKWDRSKQIEEKLRELRKKRDED